MQWEKCKLKANTHESSFVILGPDPPKTPQTKDKNKTNRTKNQKEILNPRLSLFMFYIYPPNKITTVATWTNGTLGSDDERGGCLC